MDVCVIVDVEEMSEVVVGVGDTESDFLLVAVRRDEGVVEPVTEPVAVVEAVIVEVLLLTSVTEPVGETFADLLATGVLDSPPSAFVSVGSADAMVVGEADIDAELDSVEAVVTEGEAEAEGEADIEPVSVAEPETDDEAVWKADTEREPVRVENPLVVAVRFTVDVIVTLRVATIVFVNVDAPVTL